MNEQHKIDNLFREQAGNFRPKVPDNSWSKIASGINAKKSIYKRWQFWTSVVAITTLTCIFVTLSFVFDKKTNQVSVSENHSVTANTNSATDIEATRTSQDVSEMSSANTKMIKAMDAKSNFTAQLKKSITHTIISNDFHKSDKIISSQNRKSKVESSVHKNLKKLEVNKAISSSLVAPLNESVIANFNESAREVKSVAMEQKSTEPLQSHAEVQNQKSMDQTPDKVTEFIAENHTNDSLKMEDSGMKRRIGTYHLLGLSYSLGYADTYRYSGRLKSDTSIQAETKSDNWYSTYQTQFQVELFLTNKLKVGIGIGKGKFGSTSDFEITQDYLKYININQFGKSSSGIFTANKIENLLQATNSTDVNNLKKFDKMLVVYNYLSVPVRVNYLMYQYKRFGVGATIGVDFMKLQNNSVSLRKGNEWYSLGYVLNTRQYLMGGNLGAEITYGVKRAGGFQVFLNPSFSYYFQSVNLDKEFIYRPYIFSINLGGRILL